MLTRRSLLLGLLAAPSAAAVVAATVTEAEATPGMLDGSGCHGRPRHCHGGWRVNSRGRRYIPAHVSARGSKRRRRRARGRARGGRQRDRR